MLVSGRNGFASAPVQFDTFTHGYDDGHLPDVALRPGCTGAARYRALEGGQ